jgi:polar amino acid transport system substrate-binding protein
MRRHAFRRPLKLTAGASAACLAAGLLAACGSSGGKTASPGASASSSSTPAQVAANAPLKSAVPAKWRGQTLTVAVTVFPPYEILSNGQITGLDPDLYRALGQLLGVKFRIVQTTFDAIIPGLQAGRYQVASPMGDFVERQQVLDLADYAKGSSSLLVATSSTFRPSNVMQLCGQPVGIEAGSAETGVTSVLDQRCKAAGKAAVDIRTFPDVSAATVAASSGQVRGVLSDSAANGYAAHESNGTYDSLLLSGGSNIPGWGATFAMGTPKGSGLAAALVAGLKHLLADGSYQKIFGQWSLSFATIPASEIKADGSTAHEAS